MWYSFPGSNMHTHGIGFPSSETPSFFHKFVDLQKTQHNELAWDCYLFVKVDWKEFILKAFGPRREKLSHKHLNMDVNLFSTTNLSRNPIIINMWVCKSDPLQNPVTLMKVKKGRQILKHYLYLLFFKNTGFLSY